MHSYIIFIHSINQKYVVLIIECLFRFLKSLKGYVRNKARPEGSIAEGYIVKESLTFMSMYLNEIETRFNKDKRNDDGVEDQQECELSVFALKVRPFGPLRRCHALSKKDLDAAHKFILNNCNEVDAFKRFETCRS